MSNKDKNFRGLFISPLFIMLGLAFIIYGELRYFIGYIVAILIHEFAHHITAKKLGYKLGNIYIMPYGICLNYCDNIFYENDEIIIALAGPFVNIAISIFCIAMWWCFPESYYYLDYFCLCNFALGVFNLIPCFPLDGGRILVAGLSKKYDRYNVQKYSILINYIVSFLLVIMFVISIFNAINITYITLAIFLFSGTINPEKYSSYNYLSLSSNRKSVIRMGVSIKLLAVDENLPIYKIISRFAKHKFNIVYVVWENGMVKVLSESNIYNIAQKYPISMSIKQVSNLINNKLINC